jgi:hypothetical protein
VPRPRRGDRAKLRHPRIDKLELRLQGLDLIVRRLLHGGGAVFQRLRLTGPGPAVQRGIDRLIFRGSLIQRLGRGEDRIGILSKGRHRQHKGEKKSDQAHHGGLPNGSMPLCPAFQALAKASPQGMSR